jgi:hypothetical protein
MNRIVFATRLVLVAALYPACAWAAGPTCPIERVVGQVQWISGDQRAVHLHRDGQEVPITSHACLLYGDKLEAGLNATVLIDTTKGLRHVGGNWDPEWQAPRAQGLTSPNVSAVLNTLFQGLMSRAQHQSAYAVSRGSDVCPPPQSSPPPLIPLDRLHQMNQQVGADLRVIVAAWTPEPGIHDVRARLHTVDGLTVIQDHTCFDTHIVLPLPTGALHPGDRIALELTDDPGGLLRYHLLVVEPSELPQPPLEFEEEWQLGAWRIAAGPPKSYLDAIARLQMAPPDALGARRILEAVWTGAPF